jgi:acid phosphatase
VQKLSNTTVGWWRTPVLSFLATWKNLITDAEQEMFTRSGKLEATKRGVGIAQRYQALRPPNKIWTSTLKRTIKSTQSLSAGIADDVPDFYVVQILEGKEEGANPLTSYESYLAYSSSAGTNQSTASIHLL